MEPGSEREDVEKGIMFILMNGLFMIASFEAHACHGYIHPTRSYGCGYENSNGYAEIGWLVKYKHGFRKTLAATGDVTCDDFKRALIQNCPKIKQTDIILGTFTEVVCVTEACEFSAAARN